MIDVYDVGTIEQYTENFPENPSRVMINSYVQEFLGRQGMRGLLIDFGCGTGEDASQVEQSGWRYIGTDLSEAMLAHGRGAGVTSTALSDLSCLPFRDDVFDSGMSLWALQYKENLSDTLGEWHRVLKPNAPLLLVVPHPLYKFVKYSQDYFISGQQWERGLGIERFNYYHSFGAYVNALIASEFTIQSIGEPQRLDEVKEYLGIPKGNIPYVISADLETVTGNYINVNSIESFRESLTSDLEAMGKEVEWVEHSFLRRGIGRLISSTGLPLVSLDDRYVKSADHYLGISRSVDMSLENAGYDSRIGNQPVDSQLDSIGEALANKEAVLVDDVVYSGENACWLTDELRRRGVEIRAIICGVAIGDAAMRLADNGVELNFVELFPVVDDEICERDFAFVKGSGRKIKGQEKAALYFDDQFGRPSEWASINPESVEQFCLASVYRNQKLINGDIKLGMIADFLGYDSSLTVQENLDIAVNRRIATH